MSRRPGDEMRYPFVGLTLEALLYAVVIAEKRDGRKSRYD
jgi:hypothetical protein